MNFDERAFEGTCGNRKDAVSGKFQIYMGVPPIAIA
jgi:hypothetical protein